MKNVLHIQGDNFMTIIIDGEHHRVYSERKQRDINALLNSGRATKENLKEALTRKFYKESHSISSTEEGEYVLSDFGNVNIPERLAKQIIERENIGRKAEHLIAFWLRALLNPDARCRQGIVDYVNRYGVVVTDEGMMIMYKSVVEQEGASELDLFVGEQFFRVKRRGDNPSKYSVSRIVNASDAAMNFMTTFGRPSHITNNDRYEYLGSVQELYLDISNKAVSANSAYTDWYSGTFNIDLGKVQEENREELDDNPENECSRGLHLGAWEYVEGFAGIGNHVLACVASPTDVVAIPTYDRSKIRFCRYYPYGSLGKKSRDMDLKEIESIDWNNDEFLSKQLDTVYDLDYDSDMGHLTEEEFAKVKEGVTRSIKIAYSKQVDMRNF
jgi:hypothetical protein